MSGFAKLNGISLATSDILLSSMQNEEQNTPTSEAQTTPQNVAQSPTQITEAPKQKSWLIVGLTVLTLILLGTTIFFAYQNYQLKNQLLLAPTSTPDNNGEVSTPTVTPTSDETTETTSLIPSGWTLQNNGECAVKLPIPPKEEPFYKPYDPNKQPSVTADVGSGRFWDFPRGVVYPNLLSKLPNGYETHKQTPTAYATEAEASGYVSSAIIVSCIPNTNSVDNQEMLNMLNQGLQNYNQENTERMGATRYTIKSSKETNRWNNNVYDFTMSEYFKNPGGQPFTNSVEYTMFATPSFIYEIRIMGATNDSFVKDTAQKIFDNLQFSE